MGQVDASRAFATHFPCDRGRTTSQQVPAGMSGPGTTRPIALPRSAAVVIIGGGIVGCSAAYFLANAGVSVLLCEKGRIAGEQSGRNWGWVRQQGRSPVELPMMMRSLRIWQRTRARPAGGRRLYAGRKPLSRGDFGAARVLSRLARDRPGNSDSTRGCLRRRNSASILQCGSGSMGRRDVYSERCARGAQSRGAGDRARRHPCGRAHRQQLRRTRLERATGRVHSVVTEHGVVQRPDRCLRRRRLDQHLLPINRCHGAATAASRAPSREPRRRRRNSRRRGLVARRCHPTAPRRRLHGGARLGARTCAGARPRFGS